MCVSSHHKIRVNDFPAGKFVVATIATLQKIGDIVPSNPQALISEENHVVKDLEIFEVTEAECSLSRLHGSLLWLGNFGVSGISALLRYSYDLQSLHSKPVPGLSVPIASIHTVSLPYGCDMRHESSY